MKEIVITDKLSGGRLDKLIFKYLSAAPQGFIYKMLRKKNIVLNDKKASGSEILKTGDVIKIFFSDETIERFRSPDKGRISDTGAGIEKFKELILYEDENIIAMNKPVGLLSQKSSPEDISLNEMLSAYLEEDELFTPGIANRLDRNTAGIVLAAKALSVSRYLSEAVENRYFEKKYLALVCGEVKEGAVLKGNFYMHNGRTVIFNSGQFDEPRPERLIKMSYEPIISNGTYTFTEVTLLTGKKHQIRAQLSDAGLPVCGDYRYGNRALNEELKKKYGLKSQFLCAYRVDFVNMTGPLEYLNGKTITAPLPDEFKDILKGEGLWQPGLQGA